MKRSEHLQRLRKMLQQVTPESSLESMSGGSNLESMGMDEQELDLAKSGLESLTASGTRDLEDDSISEDEQNVLEAIILPRERPVVNIINDTFDVPPAPWKHFGKGQLKKNLESVIPSIGRVEVPDHPQIPYAGTGFVVGPNLMMTNRHVAEIFAVGLGSKKLAFKPGQTAGVDFKREIVPTSGDTVILTVEKVMMIHPFWDMALLKVSGLGDGHPALNLSVKAPEELLDEEIAVVGYPAQDPRNQVELQNRIFGGVFNVKRLQPGRLKERSTLNSFGHKVSALTHDASTLGGNSGSAVIHASTGEVVALHFAGIYLKANYAVPAFELARDSRVVDLGVNFGTPAPASTTEWNSFWNQADGGEEAPVPAPKPPVNPPDSPTSTPAQSTSWTIPVQITVSLGDISGGAAPSVIAKVQQEEDQQTSRLDEGLFGGKSEETIQQGYAKFNGSALSTNGFQWINALNCVDASNLSYDDDNAVKRQARKWHLETCDPVHRDSTHCFVASTADTILVAFRGTKQLANWLTNLNVLGTTLPGKGRVHRGFLMAFRTVKDRIEDLVSSLGTTGKKVVLTGHSLGGALATIAAAEWNGQLPISSVYTYGQPAVGDGTFRTFMNSSFAGKFFRFVNDDDIVPRVPPGYVHVGQLFHFDAGNNVSHEAVGAAESAAEETPIMTEAQFRNLQDMLAAEQSGNTQESVGLEGFFPSVSDHGMDKYMGKILANL
ncbi:MAG: trypsin-like peptidase domain-containing protein [Planctomycetaceae bacterium]|nr:trypsin-like peptidase domain-containing protein [Planctomycetaceae bacterium]